jgi:hypothetical protein
MMGLRGPRSGQKSKSGFGSEVRWEATRFRHFLPAYSWQGNFGIPARPERVGSFYERASAAPSFFSYTRPHLS